VAKIFPYRYRVYIFIFFLFLITFLDRTCISLVGVRIKNDFKLSNEQFGWVLSAFALAYALFEFPSGLLSDRIGQRAVFIRIVLWWSLFTALTGVTTGLLSMITARFLFGMGEAGVYPTNAGVVDRWFPAGETGKAMSAAIIGTGAGNVLAPLIVIPLASAFGWRIPFFVISVTGIIWVWVCYSWFKNSPSEMHGISKEERDYIDKNHRQKIKKHRLEWKVVFKNRSFWALNLMFYCCQWATYFFFGWMPIYLQEGRHFSENQMKSASSIAPIGGIVVAFFAGLFSDWVVKKRGLKFGRRFVGMFSMAMLTLLIFLTSLATNNTEIIVCIIAARSFLAVTVIVSFAICIDIGSGNAGAVAGLMSFFGQMGAFFMGIIFGKIVDVTHSFRTPLNVVAVVLVAGCLFWLAIDPTKKLAIENGVI